MHGHITITPVIRVRKVEKFLVGVAAIMRLDFISAFHHLDGVCDSISPYVSMFGILWEMELSSMQKSFL